MEIWRTNQIHWRYHKAPLKLLKRAANKSSTQGCMLWVIHLNNLNAILVGNEIPQPITVTHVTLAAWEDLENTSWRKHMIHIFLFQLVRNWLKNLQNLDKFQLSFISLEKLLSCVHDARLPPTLNIWTWLRACELIIIAQMVNWFKHKVLAKSLAKSEKNSQSLYEKKVL